MIFPFMQPPFSVLLNIYAAPALPPAESELDFTYLIQPDSFHCLLLSSAPGLLNLAELDPCVLDLIRHISIVIEQIDICRAGRNA